MDTSNDVAGTVLRDAEQHELDAQRPCTRCEGDQHLVASGAGMGKYRCDTCELVVGFDLSTEQPEFLISRGLPSRYTQDRFSSLLLKVERRL
ncbi:MAG: hypothetical protein R3320_10995 [Nitriliruptorales bacterium]|nr:hypothetical protein [Nitriliruptorales bacterium]